MKPYCFLDVDGVLNTASPNNATAKEFVTANGYRICVSRTFKHDIERLMDHYDMVWLTTWEELANREFCPFFGWDEWPVVEWTKKHRDETYRQQYKLTAINKFFDECGARPWCFIDDQAPWEIAELQKRDWHIHEQIAGPYLLLHPHHNVGLTTAETDAAIAFAEENVQ